jgi:hypothetical protein
MAITHAHRDPAALDFFLMHSTLNIGSVIKSLRILAIAIGCQENEKILQNQLIGIHKNIKMKQCNLTDMNLNLLTMCVEKRKRI